MSEPNVFLRFSVGIDAWTIYGSGWKTPVIAIPVEVYDVTIDEDGSTSYNVFEKTREGEFVSYRGFRSGKEMFSVEEEAVALANLCNLSKEPLSAYHAEVAKRQLLPKGEPNTYVPFPPRSKVLFVTDDWWPKACPECKGGTIEHEGDPCPACYGRGIENNTEENYSYGPLILRPATILSVEIREKGFRYDLDVDGMSEAATEIIGERLGRYYGIQTGIPEAFVFADAETAEASIAKANIWRAEQRAKKRGEISSGP